MLSTGDVVVVISGEESVEQEFRKLENARQLYEEDLPPLRIFALDEVVPAVICSHGQYHAHD